MSAKTKLTGLSVVLEQPSSMDALERLWQNFDRTGKHSFFLTWAWVGTWLRTLPPKSAPFFLKIMRGGDVVGLACLTLRTGKLRGIFPVRQAWLNSTGDPALDCIMIEHNGLASACEYEDALYEAISNGLVCGLIPADELVLPGIAADLPGDARLLCLERRNTAYRTPLTGLNHGVGPLLSRNSRQQLCRSLRAYEHKGPLTVEDACDMKTAHEFFAGMKEFHVRSWTRREQHNAFDNPFFETFHRTLIDAAFADGGVDLLRVSAGEHILGYLYNFRRKGTVISYQSGFNDHSPGLRPGYVCHALAMAHYAKAGMSYYDFLAGTNRLKQSFGIECYELCWRRLRKPTLGFRVEALARKAAGVVRSRKSKT